MKKIAFCFLIYDIINLEELWHLFFANINPALYEIYIHYKINKPLIYFEHKKVRDCVLTKYADVSLVHAHNVMFRHALRDGCYKMINLSQACIPFKSFHYIYDFLTKDDLGYFNMCDRRGVFPRAVNLLRYYPPQIIQKSSEWFILNRKMCESVTIVPEKYINIMYKPIYAPEENFFITHLFSRGFQKDLRLTANLAEGATTFTNWGKQTYPFNLPTDKPILRNYSTISAAELDFLLNSESLFGRKFNRECLNFILKHQNYFRTIREPAINVVKADKPVINTDVKVVTPLTDDVKTPSTPLKQYVPIKSSFTFINRVARRR